MLVVRRRVCCLISFANACVCLGKLTQYSRFSRKTGLNFYTLLRSTPNTSILHCCRASALEQAVRAARRGGDALERDRASAPNKARRRVHHDEGAGSVAFRTSTRASPRTTNPECGSSFITPSRRIWALAGGAAARVLRWPISGHGPAELSPSLPLLPSVPVTASFADAYARIQISSRKTGFQQPPRSAFGRITSSKRPATTVAAHSPPSTSLPNPRGNAARCGSRCSSSPA